MTFNHKQSITALGHVVVALGVIFMGDVSFLGTAYLASGYVAVAAMGASTMAAGLLALSVALQRLKATERHFDSCIAAERIAAAAMVAGCALTAVPFLHFFNVNKHEKEIAAHFHAALAEVGPMFDEYESAAKARAGKYRDALRLAAKDERLRTAYGIERLGEDRPADADSIVLRNMEKALGLLLLPPEHFRLRKEATEWAAMAQGGTTWNAFLLGNTRELRRALDEWREFMEKTCARSLANEHLAGTDMMAPSFHHASEAAGHLDKVEDACSTLAWPSPLGAALFAGCCMLLFFPHWLQSRNSLSWKRFWPQPAWRKMGLSKKAAGRCVDLAQKPEGRDDANDGTRRDGIAFILHEANLDFVDSYHCLRKLLQDNGMNASQLALSIRDDHNLLTPSIIQQLLADKVLDRRTLVGKCDIDPVFLNMLDYRPATYAPCERATSFDESSTQVFTWGVPYSGKTCVLGAVLTAGKESGRMVTGPGWQGFEYCRYLLDTFRQDSAYMHVPERTPLDVFHAVRMDIVDGKGKAHPVTLVDMAGDLYCALVWKLLGIDDWLHEMHRRAIGRFERLFLSARPDRQKIHFFIIEYGGHDRLFPASTASNPLLSIGPDRYLEEGLNYLDRKGVLEHGTEAVYIIVTKADLARKRLRHGESLQDHLNRYLHTYYSNFIHRLGIVCQKYELCDGQAPPALAFDIGDVCFANFCRLDTSCASDVLDVLARTSKGFRTGWAGKVERFFNK